jgi:hypothetical protein
MKSKQLPEVNESKNNEKIELSINQQNPGAAKPEEFVIQSEIPLHGQRGNSKAEFAKLKRETDAKRNAPYKETPDRNDVNEAEKPVTGSCLK